VFLFLCISTFSQEINDDFLKSLPEEVREQFLSETDTFNTTDSKNYESFSSAVEKDLEDDDFSLSIFGESFFSSYSSTFMPINDPAASSNYILDVDDLVSIQYLGDSNDSFEIRIDRAGNAVLPEIGILKLAGLSVSQANLQLNQSLNRVLINTSAVLTLKEIRDINILVTGFVVNPGIYVLSGYSNILYVLNSAGGVSKNGSYRNVVVKRKGKVVHQLDLYDIFVRGDTLSNISLRSGDSIVVESSNNFVPLMGAVNRQAIYEFKDGESVEDIIDFAGGISSDSNEQNKFFLIRQNNERIELIEEDFKIASRFELEINDRLFVKFKDYKKDEMFLSENEDFISKPVTVSGAVKFPGEYYIDQNQTLSELITEFGGFREDAYIFGAALFNEDAANLEKEFNSRLYNDAIKSVANVGSVARTNNLESLSSLLSEFNEIEPKGRIVTEFSIDKLRADDELNYILSPGDRIHVPYFKKIVYVFGEVLNPGTQVFVSDMKVEGYIKKSGGFNDYADKSSVIIVHPNGESEKVALKLFTNNKTNLYAGSVIYVPRDLKQIDGIELGSVMAPIISSLAISLASLNSISNN
tara:strand:+ start:7631 stop:9382 length:1752 start_codon:yes stop_codon:yes gene_type:complete